MRYGGELYVAEVSGGSILDRDGEFSPGEWANRIQQNSRNALRDLQIRMPGNEQWVLADELQKGVVD